MELPCKKHDLKILTAIEIFSMVNKVKDTNKPLQSVSAKQFIPIEDVRTLFFETKHIIKNAIEEGKHCVGWCSVDTNFMNREIDEIFQSVYKQIQEV